MGHKLRNRGTDGSQAGDSSAAQGIVVPAARVQCLPDWPLEGDSKSLLYQVQRILSRPVTLRAGTFTHCPANGDKRGGTTWIPLQKICMECSQNLLT